MNEKKLVGIGMKHSGEAGFKILKDETIQAHEEDDPTFIEQAEADLTGNLD